MFKNYNISFNLNFYFHHMKMERNLTEINTCLYLLRYINLHKERGLVGCHKVRFFFPLFYFEINKSKLKFWIAGCRKHKVLEMRNMQTKKLKKKTFLNIQRLQTVLALRLKSSKSSKTEQKMKKSFPNKM